MESLTPLQRYSWCILKPQPSGLTLHWSFVWIYIYIYIYMCVCVCVCGMMVRVCTQWPGKPGFNPRSSHTKDSRVEWRNPENGVAPSSTSWRSSYRKGSLRVTPKLRSPTTTKLTKISPIASQCFSLSPFILYSLSHSLSLSLSLWAELNWAELKS